MKTITKEELKAKMDADDIPAKAPELLKKDEEIIVYCSNFNCQASPNAARKLEAMGYTNVGDQDWQEAKYPLEGSDVQTTE